MIIIEFAYISILGLYLSIYSFIAAFSLLGTFFTKIKTEAFNILFVLNSILPFVCLLFIFNYLGEMFIAWYGQNSYEWYAFKEGGQKWYSGESLIILVSFFLSYVFGLFFFKRKIRINKFATLFYLVVSHLAFFYHYIPGMFRDYLPSEWEIADGFNLWEEILNYVIIICLIVFVYWFYHKKGKLPYPSLILK